jgi:4-hydroxy-tetrahydrodipicolinate reductase
MGRAVIKAADSAGVNVVPVSFGSAEECGQTLQVHGKDILVHGPADREKVLASVFDEHPNLIVVDYTVPSAVNGNYYGIYYLGKKRRKKQKTKP